MLPTEEIQSYLGESVRSLCKIIWTCIRQRPSLSIQQVTTKDAEGHEHPCLELRLANLSPKPIYVESLAVHVRKKCPWPIFPRRTWYAIPLPGTGSEGWMPWDAQGNNLHERRRPFLEASAPIPPGGAAKALFAFASLRLLLPEDLQNAPHLCLRVQVDLQTGATLYSKPIRVFPTQWPEELPHHVAIIRGVW